MCWHTPQHKTRSSGGLCPMCRADLRPLLKRPPRACSLPRLLGIYAAYTCYESGPFVLDLRSCFRCIFSRDCAAHQHNTEFKQQHLHGRKAKLNCKASSKSITQSKSILLATGNQHSSRQQRLHSSSKNDNGSNGNPSCRFRAQACLQSCLSVGLLSKIQTEALGAVARSPP